MTFPWNNKSLKREEGTIVAIGDGDSTILLHFRPDNVEFDIEGDVNDPTPLSCNPNPKDRVSCAIIHPNKRALYAIQLKWHVFGTKTIHWVVTG